MDDTFRKYLFIFYPLFHLLSKSTNGLNEFFQVSNWQNSNSVRFPRKKFFLKFFSDIESEEKLSLEKPTPSGLVFTAIRIVQQASKEKFNFAAASEIYEDFTIISELPLEDDLKVCTLKSNQGYMDPSSGMNDPYLAHCKDRALASKNL